MTAQRSALIQRGLDQLAELSPTISASLEDAPGPVIPTQSQILRHHHHQRLLNVRVSVILFPITTTPTSSKQVSSVCPILAKYLDLSRLAGNLGVPYSDGVDVELGKEKAIQYTGV